MSSDKGTGSVHDTTSSGSNSPDELEDALQWLENLAHSQGRSVDDDSLALEDSSDDSPFRGLFDLKDEELPDWLREVPSDPGSGDISGDTESRLDWLARMASDETVEELPTLEWKQIAPDPESQAEIIGQIKTPQDAGVTADSPDNPPIIVDEAKTEFTAPVAGIVLGKTAMVDDEVPKAPGDAAPDKVETYEDENQLGLSDPDDLDEAMAWLEELAASQEAPVEDLPSVADRALASKLIAEAASAQLPADDPSRVAEGQPSKSPAELEVHESGLDLPRTAAVAALVSHDAPFLDDEAMDHIVPVPTADEKVTEQISSETGTSLDRLDAFALSANLSLSDLEQIIGSDPTFYILRPYTLESTLDWLGGQGTAAGGNSTPDSSSDAELIAEMPDNPDEVLAWLEDMSDDETEQASIDSDVVLDLQQPTDYELTEDDLQQMPDDPDEAVSWIENMATKRQDTDD